MKVEELSQDIIKRLGKEDLGAKSMEEMQEYIQTVKSAGELPVDKGFSGDVFPWLMLMFLLFSGFGMPNPSLVRPNDAPVPFPGIHEEVKHDGTDRDC